MGRVAPSAPSWHPSWHEHPSPHQALYAGRRGQLGLASSELAAELASAGSVAAGLASAGLAPSGSSAAAHEASSSYGGRPDPSRLPGWQQRPARVRGVYGGRGSGGSSPGDAWRRLGGGGGAAARAPAARGRLMPPGPRRARGRRAHELVPGGLGELGDSGG